MGVSPDSDATSKITLDLTRHELLELRDAVVITVKVAVNQQEWALAIERITRAERIDAIRKERFHGGGNIR